MSCAACAPRQSGFSLAVVEWFVWASSAAIAAAVSALFDAVLFGPLVELKAAGIRPGWTAHFTFAAARLHRE
jgi:hypothetical protein